MPGSGYWVVKGYGATCAVDPVSRACSEDLPEFGGPISAICAAPSGRITNAGPPRVAPLLGASSSSESSRIRPYDIGLQVVGTLVLGDGAQHLAQPLQALPGDARLAEGSFCSLVLGREVGGHDRYQQTSIEAEDLCSIRVGHILDNIAAMTSLTCCIAVNWRCTHSTTASTTLPRGDRSK